MTFNQVVRGSNPRTLTMDKTAENPRKTKGLTLFLYLKKGKNYVSQSGKDN